jgi:hypothetical protein
LTVFGRNAIFQKGDDDAYTLHRKYLSVTNFNLVYVGFAYKLTAPGLIMVNAQLPKSAKDERF